MAKIRESYVCTECGARFPQWHGRCAGCNAWNSLEISALASSGASARFGADRPAGQGKAVSLSDVSLPGAFSYSSGINALDRALGRGLVPGGAMLVGGEPGIGKSTLLLQVAGMVAASGKPVLYASGEESLPRIKARAERLGVLHDNLHAVATSGLESVLECLAAPPALLVVDSVQTLSSDRAEGLPGQREPGQNGCLRTGRALQSARNHAGSGGARDQGRFSRRTAPA
jgi:DNA repair protein RadA/Sms